MAIVTRRTGVTIIFNPAVVFVNRGFVTVFMANNTTEIRIIACRMTIGTKCPFPFVFPGINREELPIVIKGGRGPSCRGMARFAIGRKFCREVVRICCTVVFSCVTAITSSWSSEEFCCMA